MLDYSFYIFEGRGGIWNFGMISAFSVVELVWKVATRDPLASLGVAYMTGYAVGLA